MSVIKSTINIDSNTVFPQVISLKSSIDHNVDGNIFSFQENILSSDESCTIFDIDSNAGNSGIIYLYCKSDSSNPIAGIDVIITIKSTSMTCTFGRLLPGEDLFIPVYAADESGIILTAKNNDSLKTAKINYFFGSKD